MAYSGYVVITEDDEVLMRNRPDFNHLMHNPKNRGYLVRNDWVEFNYRGTKNGAQHDDISKIPGLDQAWLVMLGFQIVQ